jgi:hypothetical protein
MDRYAHTHTLWEHTCCHTRRWSAARLCDRCGAQATVTIVGVSIRAAMGRLNSLDLSEVDAIPTHRQPPAPSHPSSVALSPARPMPAVRPSAANERPPIPYPRRICQGDHDELPLPPPVRNLHPDLERALVFGLWLVSGLVCALMVIGAIVEFERGNYAHSFTCGISAAAAPTSVIAIAIDGWLKHCGSKAPRV